MFKFLFLFFLTGFSFAPAANNDPDAICGKWTSAEKTITIQIYRDGNTYKGKMVWFKNKDQSKAMDEWTDKHNPNPALRNRKLIGMEVLYGLQYDAKSDTWEKGKIYVAETGKEWNAAAVLKTKDQLVLSGYWKVKFLGKDMILNRVN